MELVLWSVMGALSGIKHVCSHLLRKVTAQKDPGMWQWIYVDEDIWSTALLCGDFSVDQLKTALVDQTQKSNFKILNTVSPPYPQGQYSQIQST